jgi:hypothetical protein
MGGNVRRRERFWGDGGFEWWRRRCLGTRDIREGLWIEISKGESNRLLLGVLRGMGNGMSFCERSSNVVRFFRTKVKPTKIGLILNIHQVEVISGTF